MNCENCNDNHNGEYGSGRFCGSKCARGFATKAKRKEINQKVSKKLSKDPNWKWNPKKKRKTCLYCENKLLRPRIYCSAKCQGQHTYQKHIESWKHGENCGFHNGTLAMKPFIRKYLFDKYENQCAECGWNRINTRTNKIPLQAHHIDGNCLNNKEENLVLLCPNCHSLTDNFGIHNKGNSKRLRKSPIISTVGKDTSFQSD